MGAGRKCYLEVGVVFINSRRLSASFFLFCCVIGLFVCSSLIDCLSVGRSVSLRLSLSISSPFRRSSNENEKFEGNNGFEF